MTARPAPTAIDGDERTPLLLKPAPPPSLPWLQLSVLLLLRLNEPICMLALVPILPQRLVEIGAVEDLKSAGYMAGWVEATFALMQLLTAWIWGRLGDAYGRRRIIICGLIGCFLSQLAVGLAETFTTLVIARSAAGCLNGNIAISMSMICELTSAEQMGRVFGWMPVIWGLGGVFGPSGDSMGLARGNLIGGGLSHPVERFPHLFGGNELLRRFPYLLPFATIAAFQIVALVLALTVLKETLPPHLRSPLRLRSDKSLASPPLPSLFSRQLVLTLAGLSAFVATSDLVRDTLPLLFVAPSPEGLQLSTSKSALFLSSRGIATLVFQILAFPALCRRISHASILRFAIASRAVNFVQMKLSAVLRTRSVPGGLDAWDFASVLLLQALNGIGTAGFASGDALVINAGRSRSQLGALNGLLQSSCALMHTIAPIVAAEIYALSADRHVLDGNLYVVVGAGVGILSTLALISLRDTKAAWRDEPTHATESSDAA